MGDDYKDLIDQFYDFDNQPEDEGEVSEEEAIEIIDANSELVSRMLKLHQSGTSINAQMAIGVSPLFYAIMRKKYMLAKLMIGIGASIFAQATAANTDVSVVDAIVKKRLAGDKQIRDYMASLVADSFHSKVSVDAAKREATIKAAATIYAARGPLCDTEGYHQHQGECWNDLSQMILTFTDGIKETVQPALLTKTAAEIVPARLGTERKRLMFYIDVLRNRFARHYINEIERRTTCAPYGALRAEGLNALAGAIAMKPTKKGDRPYEHIRQANYAPGGQTIATLQLLISLFDLNKSFSLTTREVTNTIDVTTTAACVLQFAHTDKTAGHVSGFFTCGGNEFWFDNNKGVFQMPWRRLFQIQKQVGGKWVAIHHLGMKYMYYPAIWNPKKEVYIYYDVMTHKMHNWDPAKPDKTAALHPNITLVTYNTVDFLGEVTYGPELMRNAPTVVGRGGLLQEFYNPHISASASEEMPALVSASPKPFLLTRNRSGTLRRLRPGEKATIRSVAAGGQGGGASRRKTRRSRR
jgi:hypothetical protein